ncbi:MULTISPECIES: hypothetical protein [Bacillus cereus group]|uniref:hypothetical protein n=1 Tax=Bacillus cereus group TaxID=86661 RepID=UPI000818A1CF|nr:MULTISPECIES: hypothetical protein [Bacillus cereus group]QEL68860.1 hypothetical protein DN399_12615 [Bacillus sp. AR4-2]QEL74137.1 hypothetical protein DN405_12615 [Bacillus sp. SH8-8]
MNNRGNAIKQINEFISSKNEKVMLIRGTHQYAKHSLVLELLEQSKNLKTGVFRVTTFQNVPLFLNQAGYDVPMNKTITSGKPYQLKNKIIYFDSLPTKSTWGRTPSELDFAIVYPMDSFCDKKNEAKEELMRDILEWKNIKKVFIVSWTDVRWNYEWLKPYVDRSIVFDAEEENPEYHKNVLK